MNDLLLIPVIFLSVGGILILLWRLFLIASGLFLLVLSVFLFSWRDMEFICSLQRLNFTRKIWHRMDYLVLLVLVSLAGYKWKRGY